MNIYVFYFLLTLTIVIGFLLGFIVFLYNYKEKSIKPKKKSLSEEESVVENNASTEKATISNRFTDKGMSYTDLVCETENVETENYVENSRKKQNEAYTYANRKK